MISTENMNMVWASLLIDECVRNGADTFFLAPGARCAPLTLAVSRHPEARVVQHFDERGLAFAALGFARATGRPGVVITTSGTAVSNLTPAVVEAFMDVQPMLLLTADRPFELRATGANQSIPQTNAFTPYVTAQHDLPTPGDQVQPQAILTLVDDALQSARSGPVHLNCPFREPFVSKDETLKAEVYLKPIEPWLESCEPFTQHPPQVIEVDEIIVAGLKEDLSSSSRVLLIAGGGCSEAEAMAILQLADQQNWPILSDVTSGLHFGSHQKHVIRHADLWLGPAGFPEDLRPTHVLQFGSRFLSKPLLQALDAMPPQTWAVISPRKGRFDPLHRVTHRIISDIDRFCLEWHQAPLVESSPEWLRVWVEAESNVEETLQQQLDTAKPLSEPGVARTLTRLIPNFQGLVLGASMPIRDVNTYAFPTAHRIHVAANRGASGIDGTLATASGFARGLSQPTTVLLGDLTALHDLNSLALVAQSRIPCVIVIVNNHGGGIFHFLPMADSSQEFETYFGTPHALRFESAAEMFGISYQRVHDQPGLIDAYQAALASHRSWLIEVETDRQSNVEQHRALAAMLELEV